MSLMSSKSVLRIAAALFMALPAWAEIREVKSMRETADEITSETLVIFDIDNTILEPLQSLGTDQWFSHEAKELEKQGLSKHDAHNQVIQPWAEIQKATKVKAVEKITPSYIAEL